MDIPFPTSKGTTSTNDTEDYTVIKFGTRYMLRGKLGKYLTASAEDVVLTGPNAARSTAPVSKVYNLNVDGQGVGDPMDCLCFMNIDSKYDMKTPTLILHI